MALDQPVTLKYPQIVWSFLCRYTQYIDPYAYTDHMLGTGTKSQELELNKRSCYGKGQRNIIAMENGPFLDGLPKIYQLTIVIVYCYSYVQWPEDVEK